MTIKRAHEKYAQVSDRKLLEKENKLKIKETYLTNIEFKYGRINANLIIITDLVVIIT